METSQNIIESEQVRSSSGGGCGDATQLEHYQPHHHLHHQPMVGPHNGNEDLPQQQSHSSPELSTSQRRIEHLNEESIGSGVTSMEGDSNESSTNPMDDSLGPAAEMSREDEDEEEEEDDEDGEEDKPAHDEEDEHDDLEDAPAATAAIVGDIAVVSEKKTKKEPATKRFKCLHCSKSYVREFQLNTHVRKYHPEKPVKPQDTTATGTATTSPTWTQTDMEEALESLKAEKMSLVKASQQYGIPASTLWQRATRLGIMIPKNMTRTSSKDGVADAVQLLKTGQISVNKASKVFGIPPSTLYKIAKREGIQLSSPFNSATTSWTQENLQLAMDAIRTGQMSVHMASVEFKIPPGTLYGRCKREGLELSRNNPVQWTPRDLKSALEAVKTGQMSINQASEHYKISYSSLYKRVKPHFVNNNNNNNSNSNQNLPKLGNELGETDLQGVGGGGGIGEVVGLGMDGMSHPMDYESHRAMPHLPRLSQPQQQSMPTQQQQQSPVNHHQMPQQMQQYGHNVQTQQSSLHPHHHPGHYGQQIIQSHHQTATMHHYPHHAHQQQQQALPVHRSHLSEENVNLHAHHQQIMHHPGNNNGGHLQDDRVGGGGYPCHDVDKHGLTSSSGIGLNGLMGISMGFLDFAPELPAPVAVPVTEHYSSPVSQPATPTSTNQHQQQQPYSTVLTKDNSATTRHPSNNGHYNNGDNAAATASGHPGIQQQSNPNINANNGYATLQNNYYHHHSVIHSPVQAQQPPPPPPQQQQQQPQQQQNHHTYGHHVLMHPHYQQNQIHHNSQYQNQGLHHHQRHGMVPLNEDKLIMQKEGLVASGGLIDPHAATADYEEKVMVTTINDL